MANLAPRHPPCFGSQEHWVDWLAEAHLAAEGGINPLRSPRHSRAGRRTFDRRMDFCADCSLPHQRAMEQADRCVPYWLHVEELLSETDA
jgi:ribosomal protein L37E